MTTDAELVQAARAVAFAARSLERAAGDGALTLAQYRVLALVAAGDERASLLAARLTVAKPTITAVVDGLVERGLLERVPVPGDRRSIRLSLTKPGAQAVRTTERAMVAALERIRAHARDDTALIAALCDLDDALAARMRERLAGEVRA